MYWECIRIGVKIPGPEEEGHSVGGPDGDDDLKKGRVAISFNMSLSALFAQPPRNAP